MRQARTARGAEHKRSRMDIRASATQKALIERAAALEGRSLSEYVLAHVQPAAEQTIHDNQVIMLSVEDSVRFFEALRHPPEPNARLRAAWRQYKGSCRS